MPTDMGRYSPLLSHACVAMTILMMMSAVISTGAQVSFPAPITVPDNHLVKGQMDTDTLLVTCQGPTSVAVIDDLNGDGVNEVVVGCAAQRNVVVVKFTAGRDSNTAVTQIKSLIDTQALIGAPTTSVGLAFGQEVESLRYDFDGDGTNDIVISVPTTESATWSFTWGGVSIVCLGSDFLVSTFHTYMGDAWMGEVTGSETRFAIGISPIRIKEKNCLMVLSQGEAGSIPARLRCGMTSTNLLIDGDADNLRLDDHFMSYWGWGPKPDSDYDGLANVGDLDGDDVEEFIYRSYNGSTFIIYLQPGFVPANTVNQPAPVMSGFTAMFNNNGDSTDNNGLFMGAPGDMDGDGISDAAVGIAQTSTIYILYLTKEFAVKPVASLAFVLPDVLVGTIAFTRPKGKSSLYAYYINGPSQVISGFDLGSYFPDACVYNPTGVNPWKKYPIFQLNGEAVGDSAEKQKVATYFTERSKTYAGMKDAYVSYEPVKFEGEFKPGLKKYRNADSAMHALELRVRLTGKVNVVNLEEDSLFLVAKITLLGHPAGTLIINAPGGKFDVSGIEVVYKDRAGVEAPVSAGRVLLNLPTAIGLFLALPDAPTILSILAPTAEVFFKQGELKGNLVCFIGDIGESSVSGPAFGSFPKKPQTTPRAPRVGAPGTCPVCAKCLFGAQ